jgi:hypothetical protein
MVTLRKLWDDIRPNAVYTALMTILLLMWTGVVIVTHGLKWWQQAILVFLAGALFLSATIATHLMRKGSTRKDVFVQGSRIAARCMLSTTMLKFNHGTTN